MNEKSIQTIVNAANAPNARPADLLNEMARLRSEKDDAETHLVQAAALSTYALVQWGPGSDGQQHPVGLNITATERQYLIGLLVRSFGAGIAKPKADQQDTRRSIRGSGAHDLYLPSESTVEELDPMKPALVDGEVKRHTMTRHWSRIVLTTLCCLLALATSASAECAWVLWSRVTEFQGGEAVEGPFDAEEAHPRLDACQAVLQQRLTEWTLIEGVDPNHNATKGATFVTVWERNPSTGRSHKMLKMHAWRCLPDTVDPRGPKGK